MRRTFAVVAGFGVVLALASPAVAARKAPAASAASCVVADNTVTAAGLPTDEVINFMSVAPSGTSGWVLGFSSDGTWSVSVPPASDSPTYQFVSRTSGPNGSRYTVFASCS